MLSDQARALSRGEHVAGVSVLSGHRRVDPYWLGKVADRLDALETALRDILLIFENANTEPSEAIIGRGFRALGMDWEKRREHLEKRS